MDRGSRRPEAGGAIAPPAFLPRIATARLLLRPLVAADAPALAAGLGDAAVAHMLARVPHPYEAAHAAAYVAQAAAMAAARRALTLAVVREGALIGVVSLQTIPYRNRLGYWLARGHWGKGYGREAVAAVVDYAFAGLGLRHLRAGVYVDNAASRRLLARLGFRPLGFRVSQSLARGGRHEHIATVLTRKRFTETHR
jgi:RimJ/RimL family protein N-acetyltransferase